MASGPLQPPLFSLLRDRRQQILDEWEEKARSIGAAHGLDRDERLEHICGVLDRLAAASGDDPRGPRKGREVSRVHAERRLSQGYSLEQVVAEYQLLRRAVLDEAARQGNLGLADVRAVDAALDEETRAAAGSFAEAREKTLRALDRISSEGLSGHELPTLLRKLLGILVETAPSVDAVAILLSEGDELVVHASVGPGGGASEGVRLRMGEGLAGACAASAMPVLVEDASTDPRTRNPAYKGARGLYCVPLLHEGAVVGVASMASHSAGRFSESDLLLFRVLAARATSAIVLAQLTAHRVSTQAVLAAQLEKHTRREALLAGILGSSLDAIVAMDGDGRIVEWNEAATRNFGWRRDEVLGQELAEIIIPPGLRDRHRQGLAHYIATGKGTVFGKRLELRALRRNGSEFPVELTITRLGEGAPMFTGTLRDISRRKRIEQALQAASAQFRALIEASPLPMLSLDRAGLVQVWNQAAEELFGWGREEVIGRELPFVPPGHLEESRRIIAGALDGKSVTGLEVNRLRKDGTAIALSLAVAPLADPEGAVTGLIAVLADISARKRAEDELRAATRFREDFVGIVGHDLRNPLSAILSSAQLLLRHGGLAEREARSLRRIIASAERMHRMIAELLDFTRTRLGGGFPIARKPADLREICQHVIEELEFAHPSRDVRLDVRGDARFTFDPDRMAQVVSNLVGNALQHSPEGTPVEVLLSCDEAQVVLQTRNQGVIPPAVLPHVFEPGQRGERRASGLGLGLYIAQHIALAHGGAIEVSSEPAGGTSFRVVLPRQ